MSDSTNQRLRSYAGLASVSAAASGLATGAAADLIVTEVGVTSIFVGSQATSSGLPIGTFGIGGAQMTMDFGSGRVAQANFKILAFGIVDPLTGNRALLQGWGVSASTGSNASLSFANYAAKTSKGKDYELFLQNFNDQGEVGPDASVLGKSGGLGGASTTAVKSGKTKSNQKGAMDGQVYLGISVVLDGEDHYGWIDLSLGTDDDGWTEITINRWAWETDAEVAAQIPGDNPVPGVGGLVALAMGAAGVRRGRERVA